MLTWQAEKQEDNYWMRTKCLLENKKLAYLGTWRAILLSHFQ